MKKGSSNHHKRTRAIRVPVTHELTERNPAAEVTEVTAVFTAADGTKMPATVSLFQLGTVIGVGVYPTNDRGTVLRWDDGPDADPRVIHWAAPEPGTEGICE